MQYSTTKRIIATCLLCSAMCPDENKQCCARSAGVLPMSRNIQSPPGNHQPAPVAKAVRCAGGRRNFCPCASRRTDLLRRRSAPPSPSSSDTRFMAHHGHFSPTLV
eukprot:365643-Chlamydomonas_euryale.AAC.9